MNDPAERHLGSVELQQMRIVFVNPYLGATCGGIEREIISLAREFLDQGNRTTLVTTPYEFPTGRITSDQLLSHDLPTGLEILRIEGHFRTKLRNFQPANPPLWLPQLVRTVLQFDPHVVLIYNIGWPLTVLPALLTLRRKTTVLYRTAYHAHEDRDPLDPLRRRLKLGVAGLSHRLLTYSHFEKEQILRHSGIAAQKIVPVYPGVDVIHPTSDELAAFRAEYDLAGKVVISHVARLSAFKGTDTLIRALPRVRERTGRDVVLLLVGRNLEADYLSGLAQELGVDAYVRFTGPVPDRELHLAYAASDLFALPSRYESLGLTFLEAMAHGVPVIGVNTGGVPEVIRDGETGFVLPSSDDIEALTDKLVKLVTDDALRAQLGQRAAAWTREHFSWTSTANAIRALAQEIQKKERG